MRSVSAEKLMVKIILVFLFINELAPFELAVCGQKIQNCGSRRTITFAELQEGFPQPDLIYAPFAFWFWDRPLDDPATRKEMQNMARKMLQQRLNPGYAHARMNMVGEPDLPLNQWLAEEWFETFELVIEEAKKANGYFGFCNDYWWPSGRAAGRVLANNPDMWAVSLYWHTRDVAAGTVVELPASFFTVVAQLDSSISLVELHSQRESQKHQATKDSLELIPHLPARIISNSLKVINQEGEFVWQAPPAGDWRIYSFFKYYHPGVDGGRLNYLDRRLPGEFIQVAYQPYVKRLGEQFGGTIPGVFADHEGDYGYKLAWSDDLARHYQAKTGVDIRLRMPLLIDTDCEGQFIKARWHWFDAVSDIYTSFFVETNRWLAERGLYFISNLWEETLMWQASAVGDFFKTQRAFSLPGTDCLGLSVLKPHDFKETQSVAEFENRRFQSEIMGGAGWWGFNPISMKQAANAAITWGVSHIVPHGIFTTRKLESNPWLPDWFEENPLWPYLHLWTDFVRRACYINSHGQVAADVLLLNPMDSVWGICGPGVFDPAFKSRVPGPAIQPLPTDKDIPQTLAELKHNSAWWTAPRMNEWYDQRVREINLIYSQAISDLVQHRIEFLIADCHYLRQMTVDGASLRREPFTFHTMILPAMILLPLDVMEKILDFARNGGQVYVLASFPNASIENGLNDPLMLALVNQLKQLPTVTFCEKDLVVPLEKQSPGLITQLQFETGSFDLRQQHRQIDGKDFFWLSNNTDSYQEATLFIQKAKGRATRWNCESGELQSIPSKVTSAGSQISLKWQPYEAFWLVFDPAVPATNKRPLQTTKKTILNTLDGEWHISLNQTIQPPLEHPLPPLTLNTFQSGLRSPLKLWEDWGLKDFSGYLDYQIDFTFPDTAGKIMLDLGTVYYVAEVWLNHQRVAARLWPPFQFDITEKVRPGQNRLQIRVGNLVNNSYGQHAPSGLPGPVVIMAFVN